MEAVQRWPQEALTAATRPAVEAALGGDYDRVDAELQAEERAERKRDREYWEPLKRELGHFRRDAFRSASQRDSGNANA